MTRWPIEFPVVVLFALAVAVLCFLGAVFCVLVAVGRVLRERRRRDSRPGYVSEFWPVGSDSWFEKERR